MASRSNNKKRPLRPTNKGLSNKRKRASSSSSSSSVTFPLTENAIESLVRGTALCTKDNNSSSGRCLGEENQQANNGKDNKITALNVNVSQDHKDITNETTKGTQQQLVLRLRIDQAAIATHSTSATGGNPESATIPMLFGEACDGKHSSKVVLLDETGNMSRRLAKEKARNKKYDWIIGVAGYTSTEATWNSKYQLHPIICFTSVVVLSTMKRRGSLSDVFPFDKLACIRARAGTIGSFLTDQAPCLTYDDLGGSSKVPIANFLSNAPVSVPMLTPPKPVNEPSSEKNSAARALFPESMDTNRKRVQDFMAFATAMKTLKETSSSSSSPPHSPLPSEPEATIDNSMFSPTKPPTVHAAELYSKTIDEFTSSQMDRQNASLGTNAGRESADRAALIVQRHKDALEMAMKETRPLTVAILRAWHRILLKDIHPEAGEIRTRTVRCGQTVFCPTSRIHGELENYCSGLSNLSKRLDMNNASHSILYAAVAMYGIVDIHPFLDGNGRLSRIVANYALKHLPFPINLFATPCQRAEYVLALEQTRHVLSISGKGDVTTDQLLQVVKFSGIFDSLTTLLMDRVAKAALECKKVWQEKSGMAAEAAEARAARRVRERAAQGTCIICFDDRPNIATLCCGKATHLNCIAEWLSGKNTCPICRSEMPSISGRVVRAARRSEVDTRTEERNIDADEVLEAAQQQILQNIRETRDLLAREYDRVAHRGRRRGSNSSDSSSFLSDPSHTSILDTTTTTTSDEEENELLLLQRSGSGGQNSSGSEQESMDSTTTTDDSEGPEDANLAPSGFEAENDYHGHGDSNRSYDANGADGTTTTTSVGVTNPEDETRELSAGSDNSANDSRGMSRSRQVLSFCAGEACRNQAAVDCANHLCGRCCVLAGEFHCPRHNS
ncbi:filamentation induced by cAMP protein fic [Nitzschia inconspicua]|uniref:Filamentation induced by cAMP protein fic n=1 Tax=Nitzschia inconspicua TaxID=303405 RepID=A0A9K3LM21_9STRA|nr:filamentation induced by cAMP protein fic [Nitzschia inconspicua]